MNCVVGVLHRSNEKLRIKEILALFENVLDSHRIHMMYDYPSRYLSALYSKVASQISYDDAVSYLAPLP